MTPALFPRVRLAALAWLAVWLPTYLVEYGWHSFLAFCDVAVVVTVIGLWRGSALLLSSQAIASLLVDLAWCVDVSGALLTGRHLIGGTEYMWDPAIPAWIRALSLFHVVMPPLLLWALRQTGYEPRGLHLQAAVAAVLLPLTHVIVGPEVNLNYSQKAVFLGRPWGPPLVHLAVTWATLVGLVYWPTHRALAAWLPPARRRA